MISQIRMRNTPRDDRSVDSRRMAVREKIIPGMREHNGTEPELLPEEQRFIVRLWKEGKTSRGEDAPGPGK